MGVGEKPDEAERRWFWAFVAFLVVVGLFLEFWSADGQWFFFDDWVILAQRDLSLRDLTAPYWGHWVAIPQLLYHGLFRIFGLHSYRPYVALVILAHLAVCLLIWTVMRRSGVRSWLATIVAGSLAVFAPGAVDFLWGFQITLIGSLALGLVQLVAADHDGDRLGRRDVGGLAAGLASLMFASSSLVLFPVVGVVVLVRRGWRRAVFHVLPVAVVYGSWLLLRPPTAFESPRPPWAPDLTMSILAHWLRRALSQCLYSFTGSTRLGAIPVVLLILLFVGLALAWHDTPTDQRQKRLLLPIGLAASSVLTMLATGMTRWWYMLRAMSTQRYWYLYVALMLPILATAIEALVKRWARLAPLFVIVALVGVPHNVHLLAHHDKADLALDRKVMAHDRAIIEALPALAVARDTDPLLPALDHPGNGGAQYSPSVGWVLKQTAAGRIHVDRSVPPKFADTLTLRFGLVQLGGLPLSGSCRLMEAGAATNVGLDRGDVFSVNVEPIGKVPTSEVLQVALGKGPPRSGILGGVGFPRSYQLAQGTRFRATTDGMWLHVWSPTSRVELCR